MVLTLTLCANLITLHLILFPEPSLPFPSSVTADKILWDKAFCLDRILGLGFTAHVMAERFIPEHLVSRSAR